MKIKNMLVVEKYTSLEYSKKYGKLEKISQQRLESLEESHNEHVKIKKKLLELLKRKKIEYKIIKDDQISKMDYNLFDAVMSLGGDGTALHAMSNITNQIFFGVNTDKKKSFGKLTKLSNDTLEFALDNYLLGKENFEFYSRLYAQINDEQFPYLAVNEILIANPLIYKTTHLEFELNGKISSSISNGIIISTKQGSSAFYKSSGAKPFLTENIGYNLIMPFNLNGELEKTGLINVDEKIIIRPKREHYKLIFDCHEKKAIELHQGDIIQIGVQKKDRVKIAL